MHPVICKIGPFTIYSYGLLLAAGFTLSLILLGMRSKKGQVSFEVIFNFSFLAFIFGVIGARIFYVAENAGYYIKNPREIIMLQHGGLSWFGGLVLGGLAGILFLKNKKVPVYPVLDLIIPYVALAQAIGRIGCLLNGCCFGKASQFGIYFDVHQAVLIPTQLFSSLILLFIFIILRFLQERPHKEGQIFFTYLLLYSLKRFSIEFWRADNAVIFSGLTLFQLISILIFFLAFIKLLLIGKSK